MSDLEARWAGEEEIASLLDVLTARCSFCEQPARVPEDVLAVLFRDGERQAVVACERCTPTITKLLEDQMRKDLL